MLDDKTKHDLRTRLRRAEGQIGALHRMVDEDEPCVDVLLQVSAVQGALGKLGQLVLAEHIRNCVADAFETGGQPERDRKVAELMQVFGRYAHIGGR